MYMDCKVLDKVKNVSNLQGPKPIHLSSHQNEHIAFVGGLGYSI